MPWLGLVSIENVRFIRDIETFLGICFASILDCFLIFVWHPRRIILNTRNRIIAVGGRPSLMILPDDVLYMVLDYVRISDRAEGPLHPRGDLKRISSLSRLSNTNRRMRVLASPLLFEGLRVGAEWNWYGMQRALRSIKGCPDAHLHTKRLRIDIWIGRDPGPKPPRSLPHLLAGTLLSLPRLEYLELDIPIHHTESFRRALLSYGTASLPSVQSLVLSPYLEWMLILCRNVKVISTHDYRWIHAHIEHKDRGQHYTDLVHAASRWAPKLQHLKILANWDSHPQLLPQLAKSLPHLRSFAMTGIARRLGLETVIFSLSHMKDLQTLELPSTTCFRSEIAHWIPTCIGLYCPTAEDIMESYNTECNCEGCW